MDELQQQIVQLVLAAMSGDQQAAQLIQNIMQAAQQGDQQAARIAQMILAVAQQQVQTARFGAKLNYIKQLNGQCPEGYEMSYYKEGGQLCKRCMKKQNGGEVTEKTPTNPTQLFKQMASAKCGKKMKKKEEGGAVEVEKCGGKPKLKKKACGGPMKKKACGGTVKKDACGSKMKAEQKGGRVALKKETRSGEPYEETRTRQWADGTRSRMEVSEDGTAYIGRRGEVGITNVPNDRQNAIADSLHRADWSKRTAPRLKKRK